MIEERKINVFDHNLGGPLRKLVPKFEDDARFHIITVKEVSADEGLAVEKLLKDRPSLCLVHLHDQAWLNLVNEIDPGQKAIRFSTEGFPPYAPSRTDALCFHCQAKLGHIKADQLRSLVNACLDGSLTKDHIPATLRELVKFVRPDGVLSLHILLQAAKVALGDHKARSNSKMAEASKERFIAKGLGLWDGERWNVAAFDALKKEFSKEVGQALLVEKGPATWEPWALLRTIETKMKNPEHNRGDDQIDKKVCEDALVALEKML